MLHGNVPKVALLLVHVAAVQFCDYRGVTHVKMVTQASGS